MKFVTAGDYPSYTKRKVYVSQTVGDAVKFISEKVG